MVLADEVGFGESRLDNVKIAWFDAYRETLRVD
jgi:hypothetical protein